MSEHSRSLLLLWVSLETRPAGRDMWVLCELWPRIPLSLPMPWQEHQILRLELAHGKPWISCNLDKSIPSVLLCWVMRQEGLLSVSDLLGAVANAEQPCWRMDKRSKWQHFVERPNQQNTPICMAALEQSPETSQNTRTLLKAAAGRTHQQQVHQDAHGPQGSLRWGVTGWHPFCCAQGHF